jgi:hypothetical protein
LYHKKVPNYRTKRPSEGACLNLIDAGRTLSVEGVLVDVVEVLEIPVAKLPNV